MEEDWTATKTTAKAHQTKKTSQATTKEKTEAKETTTTTTTKTSQKATKATKEAQKIEKEEAKVRDALSASPQVETSRSERQTFLHQNRTKMAVMEVPFLIIYRKFCVG